MADKINFLSGDFDTVRQELLNKLKGLPGWKDLVESGVGSTLLRLFCYTFDALSYRLNIIANENFISTCQIKEDMLKIVKFLNYKPKRAIPSYGEVKVYIRTANPSNIVLPQGTRFSTSGNITFYSLNENELLAGDKELIIKVLQGIQKEENYKSDGIANQEFILNSSNTDYYIGGKIWPNSDYEYSGIKVYIDDEEWDEVDTLVNSVSTDTVYVVEQYSDYSVKIIFGDNEFGKIPNSGSSIKFIYNLNIGKYGNVNIGSIVSVLDTINDIIGNPITLYVEQSESFLNGGDPETLDEIRNNAPLFNKSGDRAITKEDIVAIINANFSGILDTYILAEEDKNSPNFKEMNQITIGILLEDTNGSPLVANGENYLSYYENVDFLLKQKRSQTVHYKYIIPEEIEILFKVNYKKFDGYNDSTVRAAIQASIEKYLLDNGRLGILIKYSDIVAIIENVSAGVDYCYLNMKKSTDSTYGTINIQCEETQFPISGNITMTRI